MGLSAAYVGEKTVKAELFYTRQIQILLISPESLARGKVWRDMLKTEIYQTYLIAFMIDEAHLIKIGKKQVQECAGCMTIIFQFPYIYIIT